MASDLAQAIGDESHPDLVLIALGLLTRWKSQNRPNTVITKTYALRQILRAIDAEQGTATACEIKQPERPTASLTLVSNEQLSRLLANAPASLAIAVRLMRELGLRWAEALRASPSGFDAARSSLTVQTKGRHQKRFHVPEKLAELLRPISKPEDTRTYVHIMRGKPMSNVGMRVQWRSALRRAGMPYAFHPHDLRRTAAVELYEQTQDIFAVQRMLGHTSIETTAWYLKAYEAKKENHQ